MAELDRRRAHDTVMAAKKNDPREGTPFNNPFTSELRKLKRRVRDAQRRKLAAGPSEQEKADASGSAMSDEEAFRRAVAGAVPVRARGREVTHTGGAADGAKIHVRNPLGDVLLSDEHFDMRFSDQYIRGRCSGVSRTTLEKLEKGEFAVRSHVDLHGMAFDDASQTVDKFLADCQRRGERCVLVITGKGRNSPGQIGVLRERIPEWLSRGPSSRRVLAFVTARPCDGGEGALYVLLRKHSGRKARIDVESGGGT